MARQFALRAFALCPLLLPVGLLAKSSVLPVAYRLQLDVVSEGYDGLTCWFHPRAGAIPGNPPTVVLTMQKLNVKRSDVFYPVASSVSTDLGAAWTPIVENVRTLGRHRLDDTREE